MPWTEKDAHRHNHAVPPKGKRARQWADVADSALARGEDEGTAIREANGVARKGYDDPVRKESHPKSHAEFEKLGK